MLDREFDGAEAGFVVVCRGAVDTVSDGTGAGCDDVGVIFTGVVGAGFAGEVGAGAVALWEVTDVAGTVSPANAGPADTARQSVIDDNTAAVDRDLRDMSGRLDSSGVVLGHGQDGRANREIRRCGRRSRAARMNQEAVGLNR